MKYSPKYFKENMPEWKRKKDPILPRVFYRPVSFMLSSIVAQFGIMANTISYFSTIIAMIACICFVIPNFVVNIIGAILINVWLLLDCIDGNLARSVKKQPFGEFADAISSYILVGFMCTAMGISVYFNGGLFVEKGCIWIVLCGALASSCDSLMRLIHQKYKNTERELIDQAVINVEAKSKTDGSHSASRIERLEEALGVGGDLPLFILLATIFKALDVIVLYCIAFYGGAFVLATLLYVSKAIKKSRVETNK